MYTDDIKILQKNLKLDFDICATQLAGDLLLKMLKYFEVM